MMTDTTISIPFPIDDDKFFRRECPHCIQEFKVRISEEDLQSMHEKLMATFLTDEATIDDDEMDSDTIYFCPYCGQEASASKWWTQGQIEFIHGHINNILSEVINKSLIKPMKRSLNKPGSVLTFSGNELKTSEPWISSEKNDMTVSALPCCKEEIKISDSWEEEVYCFFCGFKHSDSKST